MQTGAVTTLAGTAGMPGSADGTGALASFQMPFGLATDRAGNVYVADTLNKTVRKIVTATGVVTTLAGAVGMPGNTDGMGAAARFGYPADVTSDGVGNLYVADQFNGVGLIRKVVIATGAVTTLTGAAGMVVHLNAPENLAYDGAGNLYVSEFTPPAVRKVELATATVTPIVGKMGMVGVMLGPLPGALNDPAGLAWVPGQGLVICDKAENSILIARGL